MKIEYNGKYVSPMLAIRAELIDKNGCWNITQQSVRAQRCMWPMRSLCWGYERCSTLYRNDNCCYWTKKLLNWG